MMITMLMVRRMIAMIAPTHSITVITVFSLPMTSEL